MTSKPSLFGKRIARPGTTVAPGTPAPPEVTRTGPWVPTVPNTPVDDPESSLSPAFAERIATAIAAEDKGKGKPEKEDDPSSDEEGEAKPPRPSGRPTGSGGPPDDDPPDPPGTDTRAQRPEKDTIRQPKVQTPTPFTGRREDWSMFVMQTVMYFSTYEEFFHDDRKKALWFLQWFGGEVPRMWATGIILTAGTLNEHPGLSNWKKLPEESSAMWGPTDLISDATRKLRTI
jgi:hypothetical protein